MFINLCISIIIELYAGVVRIAVKIARASTLLDKGFKRAPAKNSL